MRPRSLSRSRVGAAFVLALAACGGLAPDDFSDLGGDAKSDSFSRKMKVVGAISYGQTTSAMEYRNPPRYRAVTFHGTSGDSVDAWVHSSDGYAIGWILDASFKVIAHSEGAGPSGTESHLVVTPLFKTGIYYVVFRDADASTVSHFTVALGGGGARAAGDFYSCHVDNDCIAVPRVGCCDVGTKEAVYRTEAAAYARSFTCGVAHPHCPLVRLDDTRQPECDAQTHRCVMVEVAQIHCGGNVSDPHACPVGYACHGASADLTGSCVRHCLGNVACLDYQHWDGSACMCVDNPSCGGFSGGLCPPSYGRCVDDPRDDCDPAVGGADCPALCAP